MSKRHAACDSASACDAYALMTQVKRGLQLPGVAATQSWRGAGTGNCYETPPVTFTRRVCQLRSSMNGTTKRERLSRRSAHPLLQPLRDDALQRPDQPRQQDGRDGSRYLGDA